MDRHRLYGGGGGEGKYYLFFPMAEGLEAKWLRVTVPGNILETPIELNSAVLTSEIKFYYIWPTDAYNGLWFPQLLIVLMDPPAGGKGNDLGIYDYCFFVLFVCFFIPEHSCWR